MGFPPEMFTVIFAIARTAGWTAHWTEMIEDPIQKIGRPRQLYSGNKALKYGIKRSKKYKINLGNIINRYRLFICKFLTFDFS